MAQEKNQPIFEEITPKQKQELATSMRLLVAKAIELTLEEGALTLQEKKGKEGDEDEDDSDLS